MNVGEKMQMTGIVRTFKCGKRTVVLPVRDAKVVARNLHRSICIFERRYEMSSAEMAKRLKSRMERETTDTLRWMQKYHALRLLKPMTRMTGTHITTTTPFTKSD